jgi:hypothetical protein
MARFLVNPGTPQEWEIQLKPGPNRLGRGDNNDFTIPHGSVSGSHCEVILSDSGVLLRDLGSTNGTFINRSPVKEANLQPGHRVQLGAVDMLFEQTVAGPAPVVNVATASAPPPPPPMASPPIPPPVSAPARSGALRISVTPKAPVAAAPVVEAAPEDAVVEAEHTAFVRAPIAVGAAFCKFHPKSPARFYCNKCQKYFCDMCVTARATATGQLKTCRACGLEVTPVQVQRAASSGGEKGFFSRIPGAFIYPFKGSGLIVLIAATIVFAVLNRLGGIFAFLIMIAAIGYLFMYMQNILHSTAADDGEMPELPGFDGAFGAFFSLVGVIISSFGPAIGLLIAKVAEVDIPVVAIVVAALFGCFYFPMAFLAVAMKDTVMAANPLIVIPAIIKVPLQYIVCTIVMIGIFAIRQMGDMASGFAGGAAMSTTDMSTMFIAFGVQMIWSLVSIYLLTVTMRILGLLYLTNKHKFGWFSR